MDLKKATEIVVGMAQERSPDSPEGEALRMVLKELKEHRLFSNKAKDLTQEQRKEFFEAFCEIADFFIDKDEEGFPSPVCFPWNYSEQELHGETIKEMANNYLIELLEREEEEEEIALKILDSEFDK